MINYPITEFMIDIETLDTKPSAVILSAGIIAFNQERGVISRWYGTLNAREQIDAGRTISMSTLVFWMMQSDEARKAAFSDGPHMEFHNLVSFISRHKSPEGALYWAKSPQFDMTILESYCDDLYGVDEMPWAFRGFRDVRTLVDAAHTEDFKPVVDWEYPDHHPIGDCYWQIAEVRHARNILDKTP